MGKQESSPQPEPREPHSIDFVKFGYDKDDQLIRPMQDSLNRRSNKELVQRAKDVFGASVAAYAARAISKEELQNGDGAPIKEFDQGKYDPKEENIIRLLIGFDIAQSLHDSLHYDEKDILRLFGQKNDYGTVFEAGTVYDRLHNVEDKDLATLHRKLRAGVDRLNQQKQEPKQRIQIQDQKRRG
jgi:hypothetical protein